MQGPRTLAFALAFALPLASAPLLHLRLLKSVPEANARLSTPPSAIELWFSQPPELEVTSLKVSGRGGSAVSLAPLVRREAPGAPVVAQVKGTMSPGRYAVSWRTMAKDGHVIRGSYSFVVASPGESDSKP